MSQLSEAMYQYKSHNSVYYGRVCATNRFEVLWNQSWNKNCSVGISDDATLILKAGIDKSFNHVYRP